MADSVNSSLEEEINKIKPFRVRGLLEKIQGFHPEAQKVDERIEIFKRKLAGINQNLEIQSIKKGEEKRKNYNLLKISGIIPRNSDLSSINEDYSRFLYRKTDGDMSYRSQKREE